MNDFPLFIRNEINAIESKMQTPGNEGYLFEGKGDIQIAFWTAHQDIISKENTHDFDEYFVVVDGQVTLYVDGREIFLKKGDEYLVERGKPHHEKIKKGTRAIYAFGGIRAKRKMV